ncbi:MAG: hypothetical protein L6Q70_15640, partial [Thauera sp.]|nr:hypothetical protein [Thauera sp.]
MTPSPRADWLASDNQTAPAEKWLPGAGLHVGAPAGAHAIQAQTRAASRVSASRRESRAGMSAAHMETARFAAAAAPT